MTEYITLLDYALLPFVLAIVYGIAYKYRNKHYPPNHPWRKYFIPGLTVKILGALFISMVYVYYYEGGDTVNYFSQAQVINKSAGDSLVKWFNLVLHIPDTSNPAYYDYITQMYWYDDIGSYIVCSVAAVLSIFMFSTFLPTAVLFAAICFTGIWALFRTFARLYPGLVHPIAIVVLFIPSTFVWGSGIFKDTLCMFGLGWFTYSIFRMLIKKDFSFSNIIVAVASVLLIVYVKIYIIMAFLPAVGLWVLSIYTSRIKTRPLRIITRVLAISIVVAISLLLMRGLGEDVLGKYSLDNIENTASVTRNWISYASGDEGSTYTLGEFDSNIGSMLGKFPLAVNVTFFRPYIWEAGKPIVFLSALEALIFLFITLRLLFTVGIKKIFKTISTDSTVQFCLVFSLIFAFAVGITSYNFGALSRYKIPCLSFYVLFVTLTYYKNVTTGKRLFLFL